MWCCPWTDRRLAGPLPALLLFVVGACAPEPAPECPTGDGPWREALAAAEAPSDLAPLRERFERAAAACPDRWEPRWAVGETRFRERDAERAADAYRVALDLARGADDPVGVACAGNRLGSLAYFAGEKDEARERFDEALAAARRAGRTDLRAFVLNNLAGLLREIGDLPGAVVAFEEAVGALAATDLAKPARDAAYNEGVLLTELGDLDRARARLDSVWEQARDHDDRELAALTAIARGSLHLVRGEPAEARRWYARAGDYDAQVSVSREMGLGRAALAEGDPEAALGPLTRSARLAAEADIRIDALSAEAHLARAEAALGRTAQARDRLDRAITNARDTGIEGALWFLLWQRARLGEDARALADLEESVTLLEGQGNRFDPLGEGLRFWVGRSDPYTDLALRLVQEGAAAERVLAVTESAHARALRRVRRTASDTPDLAAIAASLPEGHVLLSYLLGDRHGVVVAVARDGSRVAQVAGWDRIAPLLDTYRASLVRPLETFVGRSDPEADLRERLDPGRELRRLLLGPTAGVTDRARRIYIVPDRGLALLPFAALPEDDGRFVGERAETAFLPVAGPVQTRRLDSPRILLAGDPLPDPEERFPRLPGAGDEITRLAELWGGVPVETLTGAEFAPEAFTTTELERFDVIHLATHAVASSLDPRRCAVVFSGGERLGFDRIAELRFRGATVLLSACRTGEGEAIPGQGVVGLGSAFLYAGAGALAVSLWQVPDETAEALMIDLHRELRAGADAVTALSRAGRRRKAETWHPAFWAPFVIFVHGS